MTARHRSRSRVVFGDGFASFAESEWLWLVAEGASIGEGLGDGIGRILNAGVGRVRFGEIEHRAEAAALLGEQLRERIRDAVQSSREENIRAQPLPLREC